ncbi:uncharacterized protein A4U43_C03F19100 [Asparagus officinalis]|uniref:Uncharacterized protein n=1 Tax=Asparagus officinalis TaxID=4686 RepID=A0A5P1FFK9_ASPOF|nr:uncharacterized protein A4U43_C03F19100 [Asparagus officinalis]
MILGLLPLSSRSHSRSHCSPAKLVSPQISSPNPPWNLVAGSSLEARHPLKLVVPRRLSFTPSSTAFPIFERIWVSSQSMAVRAITTSAMKPIWMKQAVKAKIKSEAEKP